MPTNFFPVIAPRPPSLRSDGRPSGRMTMLPTQPSAPATRPEPASDDRYQPLPPARPGDGRPSGRMTMLPNPEPSTPIPGSVYDTVDAGRDQPAAEPQAPSPRPAPQRASTRRTHAK